MSSTTSESDNKEAKRCSDPKVEKYIQKLQKKNEHERENTKRRNFEGSKEEVKVRQYIKRLNSLEDGSVDTSSARVIESSMLNTKNIQRRYILIIISTCASFLTMALRGTINVPLVSLLGHGSLLQRPNLTISDCAATFMNSTKQKTKVQVDYGEHWDELTIAVVLSSVYVGFVVTPIISGHMACTNYSPKHMISVSLYVSGLLCMVLPLAASTHTIWAIVLIRAVQGAFLGAILPAIMTLFSRWLPHEEINFLNAINFSGLIVGYMIGSSGSKVLADYGPWGGWPSIFYIYGTATEVFCCLWVYFITDCPLEHSTINPREKAYIMKSVSPDKTKARIIPWCKIMTSLPVWALILLMFCVEWLLTSFGAGIPEFSNDILMYDLSEEPVLSWIPYFLLLITTLLSAKLADILVKHQIMHITTQRKIMALFGIVPAITFIIAINFIGCDRKVAVMLFCLGFAFLGPGFSTAMSGALDISRSYGGVIFGMAFSAGSLANFLIPFKAAFIIQTGANRENLSMVLYSTAGVAVAFLVAYVGLGSGERQSWDPEMDELEQNVVTKKMRSSNDKNEHSQERRRKDTVVAIQLQELRNADKNYGSTGTNPKQNSDVDFGDQNKPGRGRAISHHTIEVIEEVPEEEEEELVEEKPVVVDGIDNIALQLDETELFPEDNA